ncbi:MAG: preprotein translocase subunit SecG [Gemmatimonadetes bacterium]|nr:MAG: preprotein translocase subunit SecG [Gemmatimonadota bacterium]
MVSKILMAILLLDSFVLAMAVLLQAGQGGGLASLGGGSGTEMFMGGRQATTLLTKITWSCAGLFLFLSLCLAILSSQGGAPRSVLEGNVPAPEPVQAAPLPLQTTPQQTTPPHQPPSPNPHP